jgi:hypothetical protein
MKTLNVVTIEWVRCTFNKESNRSEGRQAFTTRLQLAGDGMMTRQDKSGDAILVSLTDRQFH